MASPPPTAAQFAEVVVDIETGTITVERLLMIVDCGRVINPLILAGQIQGGVAQGIGLALTEDFDDLEKHTSMRACGMPYPKDVTDDLTVLYLETPRPLGPYGASGCGEAPVASYQRANTPSRSPSWP